MSRKTRPIDKHVACQTRRISRMITETQQALHRMERVKAEFIHSPEMIAWLDDNIAQLREKLADPEKLMK